MSQHGVRTLASWLLGILDADPNLVVGLGRKPDGTLTKWAVIYPIAGGTVDGSLSAPSDDATPDIQVTCVAAEPDQALWVVDKVRTLIAAAVPATLSDGRRVQRVEPTFAQPTLIRDDDVSPPAWYCPDRFSFRTTT